MRPNPTRLRNGLTAALALSLFASPLALGSTSLIHPAGAATPFQTLVPHDPNLPTAVGEVGPIATPVPTVFPGQYFEHGDSGRPPVDETAMEGDLQFGFQQLADDPDLYMVWMTDKDGTHYMIVKADSDVLTGGNDPQSGFLFLVREREKAHDNILTTIDNRDTYLRAAKEARWWTVGLLAGTAVCVFLAGPACLVGLGLAGGAFWASRNHDTAADIQQNLLEGLQDQLSDVEGDLRFGFQIGQATETQP
jgi:hypothetical protein